jgi:hypothetical protein
VVVSAANTAFSSWIVSSTTEKSVSRSTLLEPFNAVSKVNVSFPVPPTSVSLPVPRTACRRPPAFQGIAAGVSDDCVVARVARAEDVIAARQGQLLDVPAKREGDRAPDQVRALSRHLDHGVAGSVHRIGVVARAAFHPVGANPAVERVVGGVSDDRVVERVARAIDGGAARQGQLLDIHGPK